MVWDNKRRWGGYTVHVGMVVVFFGIAASSAYQREAVQQLRPGQFLEIGDYLMRYEGFRLEAKDDHVILQPVEVIGQWPNLKSQIPNWSLVIGHWSLFSCWPPSSVSIAWIPSLRA